MTSKSRGVCLRESLAFLGPPSHKALARPMAVDQVDQLPRHTSGLSALPELWQNSIRFNPNWLLSPQDWYEIVSFCGRMYNVYHRLPLPSTTNLVKIPITQFPGNNKRQQRQQPGTILGDLSLCMTFPVFPLPFLNWNEAELTEVNHSEPNMWVHWPSPPHIPSGSLAFSRSPRVRITPALVFRAVGSFTKHEGEVNAEWNHQVHHRSWTWKPAWEVMRNPLSSRENLQNGYSDVWLPW